MKRIRLIIGFLALLFMLGVKGAAEEDYLSTANLYFNDGKFNLAEIFYRKFLEQKPDHFDANYSLGKICYFNGRYDEAAKYLQTAYDLKPEKEILFLMANAAVENRNAVKGLSMYSNLMKSNPDYGDVYLNAGLVAYKYLSNKELTINFWRTFLQLRPEDVQAPKIRKALEYLQDPNFVLTPAGSGTNQSAAGLSSPHAGSTNQGLLLDIKGKDIKSDAEEKYDLKKPKSITTE